ncbi:predicted protein [Uncinocarpus reesii 1704]|uniref:Phytanoyl-CoA dioxygenase n=1 Tax=Uncinocarpus reesii (strain UAMH 1704) TaxID=336963 RepID=C4JN09_UNCRE|nr:uncharacterized protein UREG_04217 [Uncinocarpus reesii 1704]EEP79371.1 predicted protein [Uncinocarpus reesii 1704]
MTVSAESKPQIPRVSVDSDLTQVKDILEEHGTVIVESLVPRDVVDRLNKDLDPLVEAHPGGLESEAFPKARLPVSTKWLQFLTATCKTFREDILNNSAIHTICEDVFEPLGDYWLISGTAMDMAPGCAGQPLHRDDVSHPIIRHLGPEAPITVVAFLIALTPFTAENGSTRVILGSHKWPTLGRPNEDDTVRAVMNPGDAILITGRIVHGGSRDTTGTPRRLLSLGMGISQLTPYEAHSALPRKVIESMTPVAQRMVGWRSLRPAFPNVIGLQTVRMEPMEDYLELKSEQPLEEGA